MVEVTRRRALVYVTPEVLTSYFKNGNAFECIDGLPDDAELLGSGYNPEYRRFFLEVYSSEFDKVDEGEQIPIITPEMKIL